MSDQDPYGDPTRVDTPRRPIATDADAAADRRPAADGAVHPG